jgi:hypothetical protein
MTQESIDVINSGYEMVGMIESYPAFVDLVSELEGLLPNKEKLVKLSLADFSLNIILQAVGIATSILLLVLSVVSGGATAFQAAMAIATAVLAGVSCWLI